MRRAVLIVVVCGLLQPALAVGQVAESLREQAKVRESLLANQLQDLGAMREKLNRWEKETKTVPTCKRVPKKTKQRGRTRA